jgi:hypothetical protein
MRRTPSKTRNPNTPPSRANQTAGADRRVCTHGRLADHCDRQASPEPSPQTSGKDHRQSGGHVQ